MKLWCKKKKFLGSMLIQHHRRVKLGRRVGWISSNLLAVKSDSYAEHLCSRPCSSVKAASVCVINVLGGGSC